MARTVSGTLTAGVVEPVDIAHHAGYVEIVNRSQTGEIWVRTDGVDPVAEADDCYVVLGSRKIPTYKVASDTAQVKLVSTEALKYTVEASG